MPEKATTKPAVRRQARGQRRMEQILDAALACFAERGYAASSTNLIASRAGISPGSLYQFFSNKEAIAEALAQRVGRSMAEAHSAAFEGHRPTEISLPELIDRMIDPLVAFNLANPGAKTFLGAADAPPGLAEATRPLHDAVLGRVTAIVSARAPSLSAADAERTALVAVQIFAGVMPTIAAAKEAERPALIAEVKRALVGYLAPIDEQS